MMMQERAEPGGVCTGKLFWVWGAYAYGMLWLSHAMEAAKFSQPVIWTLAAGIGVLLVLWMREF